MSVAPPTLDRRTWLDTIPVLRRLAAPLHRPAVLAGLFVANLVMQMVIIVTGGLVRLTGSGLGCPTWPECVPGSFVPTVQQAQGYHKFIEFGNRSLTFVLGFIAIGLVAAAWLQLRDARPGLYRWSWAPLGGIVAQAVLGGIVVLAKLDPWTVSPHFLLSVLLVAISAWLLYRSREGDAPRRLTVPAGVHRAGHAAAALGGLVIVLGTLVTGSGPHSGDSTSDIRFGLDPLVTTWVHGGAATAFVVALLAVIVLTARSATPERVRLWWLAVLVASIFQGLIGYLQTVTGLPAALVVVHLAGAAVLTWVLATAVMTTRAR